MPPTQIGARPPAWPRSRPFHPALILTLLAVIGLVLVTGTGKAHAIDRTQQTMYTPPSSAPAPGSLYPRAIRLQHSGSANGTLLASFEQYTNGTPVFPIYRSTDNGNTWTQISSVADTQNGWGMRWEPDLYELPSAIGNYPAGTILIAGDSVPANRSATKIDLYASTDHGMTWTFVSNIATGGQAISSNGYTPVWEPFLLVANGKLICYYSDQRDTNYGQKLVHQTSTDGVNWGPVVNDVTYSTYADRPGMATVAQLPDGNYVMTYEFGGAPEGSFSVYYKISANPEAFGSVTGIPLKATDGTVPSSSPFITWLPTGGPDGTLVVSANSSADLFLNTQNGAANTWTEIPSNVAAGYSRGMVPLADGHSLLVLSGGPNGSSLNPVTYATIDLGGGISDGATYTLSNANSGLMLTMPGGTTTDGTQATQQNADSATDQKWRFAAQPDGYFKIYNVASGKVLGVQDQSTANGAPILQWDDNGTLDHEWAVAPNPAGGYTLTNHLSNAYLEIPNASNAAGTAADQWSATGCSCQRWNFTETALPTLTTGQYALVNKNSGQYLDMPNWSTKAGTQADQWPDSACPCQLWAFQAASNGAYTVQNVNSGLDLDVSGSSSTVGAAIVQNAASGDASQQWTLVTEGGGYYKLENVNSGMVAGVGGSSTSAGAGVIQWNNISVNDQLWQIVRIN